MPSLLRALIVLTALLVPFAAAAPAVAGPGPDRAGPEVVAAGSHQHAPVHCCAATGHQDASTCPMLDVVFPSEAALPGPDAIAAKHPFPRAVSFSAFEPAGLVDPPPAA